MHLTRRRLHGDRIWIWNRWGLTPSRPLCGGNSCCGDRCACQSCRDPHQKSTDSSTLLIWTGRSSWSPENTAWSICYDAQQLWSDCAAQSPGRVGYNKSRINAVPASFLLHRFPAGIQGPQGDPSLLVAILLTWYLQSFQQDLY